MRWVPLADQAFSFVTAPASAGSFGVPRTRRASGSDVMPRRSVVPACSIASTISGSVSLWPPFRRSASWRSSICERKTELNRLESAPA